MKPILIIGGGLAGCEAAWQIAKRGGRVLLFEMKPKAFSEAHRSSYLAELVCSNSLKSESIENASGILKEELALLDSLILKTARETRVPAGEALAVDRELFSKRITEKLESLEGVEVIREEVKTIPEEKVTIISSGPLTSWALSEEIKKLMGREHLFFYDAISPIVTAESIDFSKTFKGSRYGKGGEDYLNCPMDRETYEAFVNALCQSEKVPLKDFEKRYLFEGCLPIEEMAGRGIDTLAFGPLKPVGLIDPRTNQQPYAVVQLRLENEFGTLFNLVGCQTRLKRSEQARVFRMIPGLEKAEFVRWGSVHRNTFIDSPRVLKASLQMKERPWLFFAGQITGVEGYMESTAMGLLAGINASRYATGIAPAIPPPTTAMGALINHLTRSSTVPFQPMNINLGLFSPLKGRAKGRKKRALLIGERARRDLEMWKTKEGI